MSISIDYWVWSPGRVASDDKYKMYVFSPNSHVLSLYERVTSFDE